VLRAGRLRERLLEGGAVLAERQLSGREALIDRGQDLATVFFWNVNLCRGDSHLPPLCHGMYMEVDEGFVKPG
jgi:hypothetical protein